MVAGGVGGRGDVGVGDFVVECRSEPRCAALPVRFGRPGRMREVVEILDRWDGEDHRYFRVLGDDGSTYILRQDLGDASWRVQFYRRGGSAR
jgi:hypothetical protein